MINRLLASIGIGSARVDTILDSDEVVVGGTLFGKVVIEGGSTPQKIDAIEFELTCKVEREVDSKTVYVNRVIESYRVLESFEIGANQREEFDLKLDIPLHTPITIDSNSFTYLKTKLDIDNAIDPKDSDMIKVLPSNAMVEVVNIVENLGFKLNEIDIEESRIFNFGYIQEFEFKPVNSKFHLKEIELIFLQSQNELKVYIQKDRRVNGVLGSLLEATGLDESWHSLTIAISNSNISEDRDKLKSRFLDILN